MIVGVSLFVRMVQVLFRPRKMHHSCSACGLSEHESDAVHCKRCGTLLTLNPGRDLMIEPARAAPAERCHRVMADHTQPTRDRPRSQVYRAPRSGPWRCIRGLPKKAHSISAWVGSNVSALELGSIGGIRPGPCYSLITLDVTTRGPEPCGSAGFWRGFGDGFLSATFSRLASLLLHVSRFCIALELWADHPMLGDNP